MQHLFSNKKNDMNMRTLMFILGYIIVAGSLYALNLNYCCIFVGISAMAASIIEYRRKEGDDEDE